MTQVDRSVFNQRIGEIALSLGVISAADQQRMHDVQARALTIVQRGGTLPSIKELADDAHWERVAQVMGISEDAVTQARQLVTGPNPIPVPGVPPAGAVLSDLNALDPVVKDSLLAMQASEKALAALDRAKQVGLALDHTNFDARLNEINGQADFAHLGRGGESALVANAQRVYKTALQFEALEHHVDCTSSATQDPEFAQLRQMLESTLPGQVRATYRTAAIALGVRAAQLNNPEIGTAADAVMNTLVTQLNVAPATDAELQQILASMQGAHTAEHGAGTVAHTTTTAHQIDRATFAKTEEAKRQGGAAPQAGLSA